MRSFILGTDWGGDCDDVMAARILARAHKAGRIRFLGAVINHCIPASVESLDVFLKQEGLFDLPIGLDRDATDIPANAGAYQSFLLTRGNGRKNEDAEVGFRLYRRLLAEATGKVNIVEIGFLQVVARLLESGPDDLSPLTGVELVREKVERFWIMGGRWDVEQGKEFNLSFTPAACLGAYKTVSLCPVPITFLGFEVGEPVICGGNLPESDLLKGVLNAYGVPNGRCSWDPMTAALAICGNAYEAGFGTVRGKASVDPETGVNSFEKLPDGPHEYVVCAHPVEYYKEWINRLIE